MAMMGDVQFSAKNLSHAFDGVHAVVDLSFEVRPGTISALIGPNGAGKTTVFNIVSGFVAQDVGTISIAGRVTTGMRPHEIARLGLGRTFQDCKVFDQLSVLDNVMLGYQDSKGETLLASVMQSRSLRLSEDEKRVRAMRLLNDVDLCDKAESQACELSYGQRKLLEICRVRALEPKIYLLDEPFAGLFPDVAHKMGQIIRNLCEAGRAVIFIEHDMEVVERLADRILVLDFGRLIADGSPGDVLNDAAVLNAYLRREHS